MLTGISQRISNAACAITIGCCNRLSCGWRAGVCGRDGAGCILDAEGNHWWGNRDRGSCGISTSCAGNVDPCNNSIGQGCGGGSSCAVAGNGYVRRASVAGSAIGDGRSNHKAYNGVCRRSCSRTWIAHRLTPRVGAVGDGDRIVHHGRIRQSFGIDQRGACCGADGFGHLRITCASRTELEAIDAIAIERDRADGFAIKQIASCGGIEDVDGEVFATRHSSTIGVGETALVVDQAGNLATGEKRGGQAAKERKDWCFHKGECINGEN